MKTPRAASRTDAGSGSHAAVAPPAGAGQAVGPDQGLQRRSDRRTPYRVPCRVRVVGQTTGETRTMVGETVNLSAGGMAIQVALDLPLGTKVETLVPHADGAPLFLCGTVVHSRRTMRANYEIGVALADGVSREEP